MNASLSLKATVIVPTYNRPDYLSKCLDAIANQKICSSVFEIIVVDNNSQKVTEEIVQRFVRLHPQLQIRYIRETNQGTSFARNRGIKEANGEILCFADDDTMPHPNWLNELLNAFSDKEVGCAGGPMELDYQGREQPLYFQGDLQGLLGGFHLPYNKPAVVSTWTEFPWGGNMAFRKSVFPIVGFFSTALGPSADIRLTAEETEFIQRLYEHGYKVLYVPGARTRHLVPPERLNKSYIYHVGYGLASSHVILTSDPRLYMIMRWFMSDIWYALRLFGNLVNSLLQRKPLWFDDYIRYWMIAKRIPIRLKALMKGYYFSNDENVRNLSKKNYSNNVNKNDRGT